MTAPYARGDFAVWFEEVDGDLEVRRTVVKKITETPDGRWRVKTADGVEEVGQSGEGPQLAPIDDQLAQEFATRGDRYTVTLSTRDIDPRLEQNLKPQSLDHGHERGLGR